MHTRFFLGEACGETTGFRHGQCWDTTIRRIQTRGVDCLVSATGYLAFTLPRARRAAQEGH